MQQIYFYITTDGSEWKANRQAFRPVSIFDRGRSLTWRCSIGEVMRLGHTDWLSRRLTLQNTPRGGSNRWRSSREPLLSPDPDKRREAAIAKRFESPDRRLARLRDKNPIPCNFFQFRAEMLMEADIALRACGQTSYPASPEARR
jgi:hypothetical protein